MARTQQKQSSQAPASTQDLPQPLGPDSHTWRNFGSYLFHLMLPQAFILQSAHPVIDMAVGKEKKYKHDPWGRAKDSTRLLWPVIYARPDKATEMGIRLRELHRSIKGVANNGKKFHALDPEAYSWVHITGFDATLRMYEYFGRTVADQERAELFREWQRFGRMLGIHEKHIPRTEAEYWQHFNYIIEERLEWGEVLDDLMDPRFYAAYPKPEEMKYVPDALFKVLMIIMGWAMHKITVATLPENFRRKFNVQFSKTDQRLFKAFAWSVRTIYPVMPERLRYIPLAMRAIEDSRRYPGAYQFEADLNQDPVSV
ncbi:MAG: oxygenase MpaB family protein [Ketobacter sp.]